MSDLSPEERQFLENARAEWGPSDDAAPPTKAELRARLADKPWLAELGPSSSPTRFGGLFAALAIGVGAISVVVLHHDAARPTVPAIVTAASAPISASTVVMDVRQEPPAIGIDALPDAPTPPPRTSNNAPRADRKSSERAPAASADAPIDTLAEELSLIHAAQSELRRGDPDRAIAILDAHASRFPHGVLRDERLALDVLALCARGDVDAARAVKSELERSSPRSSHLGRLASSCVP